MATTKNKTITSQYRFAKFITKVLNELKLDDKESFARRRFLRLLNAFVIDITAEERELRSKSCEKDAKGELKVADGAFVFKTATARKEFNKAWEALGESSFTFDVLPSNEADIKAVISILQAEVKKYTDDKKGIFTAAEYERVEDIKEFIDSLNA